MDLKGLAVYVLGGYYRVLLRVSTLVFFIVVAFAFDGVVSRTGENVADLYLQIPLRRPKQKYSHCTAQRHLQIQL